MDCKSANILMMRYMDRILTEAEARSLNVHIRECSVCKEDFMLYGQMTEDFETQRTCLLMPPEGFEARVMQAVYRITPDYGRTYTQDAVLCFIFGAFSILFGFGVILSMYRAEIMDAASNYPTVRYIMESAAKTSDAASLFAWELSRKILLYFHEFSSLIETAKYGILAIVVALVAAQYVIYSKNKVEA